MPVGWFFAPGKKRTNLARHSWYCAMDDFSSQVRAAGGDWYAIEVLGGDYIVKARATDALLTTIGATTGFLLLPFTSLNQSLSILTTQQRNVLTTRMQTQGYSAAEVSAALGDFSGTFGQLLDFEGTRAFKARYTAGTDTFTFDGAQYAPPSPRIPDQMVTP